MQLGQFVEKLNLALAWAKDKIQNCEMIECHRANRKFCSVYPASYDEAMDIATVVNVALQKFTSHRVIVLFSNPDGWHTDTYPPFYYLVMKSSLEDKNKDVTS
jgi:hypothetical protein